MNDKNTMITILIGSLMIACDADDFLEKVPKDQLTEKTIFTTHGNFKTYAWSLYANNFKGYARPYALDDEVGSDLFSYNKGAGHRRQIHELFDQRKVVPTTSSRWTDGFENIRRANLMLANIDGENSKLSAEEKKHWKGVGLFFRAYVYVDLIMAYGDVPWIPNLLQENDKKVLFGARTPRDVVAKKVLDDLLEAQKLVWEDGTGDNTINKYVVMALISRFGLYEGTWRKYHGLGGENTYLKACADASEELMDEYDELHDNYDELFNSEELDGMDGVLLYKGYLPDVLSGSVIHYNRSSVGHNDLTKKYADMFLLQNGENVHIQANWKTTEKDPYAEFRNRDHRFYYSTPPPFRVDTGGRNVRIESTDDWKYHSDPKHNEYIDVMKKISDDQHKTLPTVNWTNLIVRTSPHFRAYNEGHGYNITVSGYRWYKFYNRLSKRQNNDGNDYPLFRLGEVLLNYAEAKYELGEFDQDVADDTVNLLRERGNVDELDLSDIPNDPTRDADIDPKLWEIRRERAVEFAGEALGRAFDLKRWKKLIEYGNDEKLGRWVKNSDYGDKLDIQGGASEGYITPFGKPKGALDKYYLEPIPSEEIVLNPKLKQNAGW